MNWLFSKPEWSFSIKPDENGKKLAGFKSGNAVTCTASDGETVGAVMDRFNTYRGPEQQIRSLWTVDGKELPYNTVIHKNMITIVRG